MTDAPRPALVTTGELFGGVEQHVVAMCRWLQSRGEEPRLILFHDRELATRAREIGVEPTVLPVRGPYDPAGVSALRKSLRGRGANVVHAHGYRAVVNSALAIRGSSCALVRTVHGLRESDKRWSWPVLRADLYTKLERWAARSARASVCYVTEDLRRHEANHDRGLPARTVPNGVEPFAAGERPRPAALAQGGFHVAAVGRLTRIKGLEHALDAVASLPEDTGVVLHLLGTGPAEEELRARAARLDLGDRVRFAGFCDHVADYLAHLDALIMPSLHEGLPFTILEAMAAGLPIVASRVGGLREVLEDGTTALLVPPADAAALAAALSGLAGDRELAARLGEAARARQQESYSLAAMGEAYWEVYAEALARRAS